MTVLGQIFLIIYAIIFLGGLYALVRIGSATIPEDRLDLPPLPQGSIEDRAT